MSYRFDTYDNALVIEGWEKGVGDSEHSGLADMRNVNIMSVPGEAAVNFATASVTQAALTKVVTSLNVGANTLTFASPSQIENGIAITFSAVGSITGISINTPYWVSSGDGTNFTLYSDWFQSTTVTLGGTVGSSPTFTTYTPAQPKYFAYDSVNSAYYLIDSAGLVWSNKRKTATNVWIYTGNNHVNVATVPNQDSNANGNGLVFYAASDGTGFIFAFRNGLIDYLPIAGTSPVWVYGWNPASGTTGNTATILKTVLGTNNPHEALLAPDNRVYFCDKNWIDVFYETNPGTPFVPTNTATYTWAQYQLLPSTDLCQCLAFLGTSILIGGQSNILYPWDRSSTHFSFPILIAEYNIKKMVTVNTNTYIFVGNRGRIYVTNGTNASLFKKVPDHISGTIEPYFSWGGVCTVKNQIYFSCKVTTNSGSAINQYGGIWAIDIDTMALRLTNKLSYGSYAGSATALIPIFTANPAGTGLYIGWDNASSGYGIDSTVSTPYVAGEATIDSDLIPLGTFTKPKDMTQLEYKLVRPLVSGESIKIQTRLIFNTTDTGYSTGWTDSFSGSGQFSNSNAIDFLNAQWVQFKITLTSTASSPSYVRLKHIRILGLTGAAAAQSPLLDIGN